MFDQGFASRFPMIARHLSISLEQLQVGWMTIMVGLSPWAFGCVDRCVGDLQNTGRLFNLLF